MAWAIITIYISKCVQMNPPQLPKMSKFYFRSKKCGIEKTLGVWVPPPLVARRLRIFLKITDPSEAPYQYLSQIRKYFFLLINKEAYQWIWKKQILNYLD